MSKINDSCYENVKNMYVMSDIHGDLDLLIINLRDCAKVIRPKNNLEWRDFAKITIPNISIYKLIDIDIYDCLFNFEWCGGSKWIIIIGDIIDNYRKDYTIQDKNHSNKRQNEIEYEELKILLFLNKLNKVAQKYNGCVVKLIGNHEDMNINNYNISRYVSEYALNNDFYTIKRKKIFSIYNNIFNHINYKYNSIGKKYVIFKINDFIFLHGGLNKDIIEYFYNKIKKDISYINKESNLSPLDKFIDYINNEYNKCIHEGTICKNINDNNGILWYRDLSTYNINFDNIYCDKIDKILEALCNDDLDCAKSKYIIVGHCIQSEFSLKEIYKSNGTHSIIKKKDNVHIISGPIIDTTINYELYKKSNKSKNSEHISFDNIFSNKISSKDVPKIFGITASCIKSDNPNLAKIYRVDIGASRAFDNQDLYNDFIKYFNNIYNKLENIIKDILKYKQNLDFNSYNNIDSTSTNNLNILLNKYKIHKSNNMKIKYILSNNNIYYLDKMNMIIELLLYNNKKFKKKLIDFLYRFYVSRLPQLLHICYNNNNNPNTRIIRSTFENTILNMIRNNIFPFDNNKYNNLIRKIIKNIDNNI